MTVPLPVRAAAVLELRERRRRAPAPKIITTRYGQWLKAERHEYSWEAPHFVEMQKLLDDMTARRELRVFFQIPIRHGKSEHNTIRYAAYRLKLDPKTRILVCSYNQRQANTFSRAIRRVAREVGVDISPTRDAVEEWETTAGGGVRAVGAGTGLASVNADVILIDDPIGSREDAESQATRDQVWDWLTNDVLARCEPHTAVAFTMSRWHKDDPAGRLRDGRAGPWKVLDLPGEAEPTDTRTGISDALGRAPGEPLWPEQRSKNWLREKRVELGDYGFASQIQGRPRPREGGMFKWDWWQLLEDVPTAGHLVRYWDLAGTRKRSESHDPDFTAGPLLCRMIDLRIAIVDVVRFRKSAAARDAEMERICIEDLQQYGGRVEWWIEAETGISGEERTTSLVRRLQACGMPVSTEHPTGSKVLRAEPVASAAEAHNIVLCPGAWRDAFRGEAADFPTGEHDDQIDGVSGAYAKLADYHIATVHAVAT